MHIFYSNACVDFLLTLDTIDEYVTTPPNTKHSRSISEREISNKWVWKRNGNGWRKLLTEAVMV